MRRVSHFTYFSFFSACSLRAAESATDSVHRIPVADLPLHTAVSPAYDNSRLQLLARSAEIPVFWLLVAVFFD